MRTLFAVGMRGPVPSVEGREVRVLPLERVREAARARSGGTTLFMGPEALRRLSPDRVLKSMPFPYVAVVLIPAPGLAGALEAWRRIGVTTLSPGDSFGKAVADFERLSPRVRIPEALWVPEGVELDPALGHAVALLPECSKPCVVHWSAELAVERHWLTRRFESVCRVTATDVCHAYIYEYDQQERSRDVHRGHIAAALGFPNPSNLRRALRARHTAMLTGSLLG